MAMDLGASSPATMCRKEMTKKAKTNETPWISSWLVTPTSEKERLQQAGESGFTDPAQAQRGQGDAQLAGGEIGVQLVVDHGQDAAAHALCLCDGPDARLTQLDQTEFCCNEKPFNATRKKAATISNMFSNEGSYRGCQRARTP
jgi:hypothetical protein